MKVLILRLSSTVPEGTIRSVVKTLDHEDEKVDGGLRASVHEGGTDKAAVSSQTRGVEPSVRTGVTTSEMLKGRMLSEASSA